MTRLLLRASLAAWGGGVLVLFLLRTQAMTGSALGSLRTLGLGAATAYGFWLTGHRIRRRLARARAAPGDPGDPENPHGDGLEESVLELGLGTGAAMFAMTLLGACQLFRPWAAWALIAVMLLGPHARFLGHLRSRLARSSGAGGQALLAVLLLAAGAMTLVHSLAPVVSQDALVYHLAVPARYVERGGLCAVEGNFFASFPQYVEMLFTLGLLLDGESLAQGYHWMLGAAAAAAVAALARRIHPLASGLLAAAAFATVPTVTLIATWAYVDLGVVFFATASSLCLLRWWTAPAEAPGAGGPRPWLLHAALFAGLAAGCKYTGGFQGLLVAGGALLAGALRRAPLRHAVADAALAALTVGALASPWWIRNIVLAGNPLHPFCHGLFGGADWDAGRAAVLSHMLASWGGSKGLLETLLLPWRLTMDGRFFSEDGFDGMVGPFFLIAAPLLAAGLWMSREHRVAAGIALAHALFWAATTRQVRFLLPALAVAAALAGATAPVVLPSGWARRVLAGTLQAAIGLNVLIASLYFASHNPLPVVLGLEGREAFLAREVPCGDYAVFARIERELPPESYILFGSLGNPGFLCKRRYHSDALFENRTLAAVLAAARDPGEAHRALRERGFTHLLFRRENVFDPTGTRSEIPLEDQLKLMDLLNRHARLEASAGGTCLYDLGR
ncbi:MAG: hypothetical protein HY721_24615 [Planctomycetes bacterium]|nr:hypothetical protein [Planctomycetota bacterium]